METYILVHGGWSGGWQFKAVEKYLVEAGHTVYRPTLTGLGERVHLTSPEISLDTHITDILNLFKYEEIDDAILLGYSYSSMVIISVAEQIPEQIQHLVYLDGFVPDDGQSLADLLGDSVMQFLQKVANDYGDGWIMPHDPPDAHLRTGHSINTAKQSVSVGNPQAKALKRTFIHCTENYEAMGELLTPLIEKAKSAKSDDNWQYYDTVMWETHPKELSKILLKLL